MLTPLFLAAVTGLSVPSPVESFTHRDYPNWAVEDGASAASIIRTMVDPSGKVTNCVNLQEMGDPRLAKQVCRILVRKKLRSPALRDGRNVYAFIDSMIQFYLPDTAEGRRIMALQTPPDAELTVDKLPDGKPADVIIYLAFDAAGKVTDCAAAEVEKNVRLADIACGQRALFDNAVMNDLAGQPVAYVTRKKVRFSVSAGAK